MTKERARSIIRGILERAVSDRRLALNRRSGLAIEARTTKDRAYLATHR